MQALKPLHLKKSRKQEREHKVLLGLVDLYIRTGKPVGSSTLRESGFQDLSSATIRNYFSKLEKEDYVQQQHSSGGRIPTAKAYQLYAKEALIEAYLADEDRQALDFLQKEESKEVVSYLQKGIEVLSKQSKVAVFLSSPRFDHDFIQHIKVVPIDAVRCLVIMITDFGLIHTETLHLPYTVKPAILQKIESYFQWRVMGGKQPSNCTEEELQLAQSFYNEVMVRYIVGYSHFSYDDIYSAGLSQLLEYPEFNDPATLIQALSLFENHQQLRNTLIHCQKTNKLSYWIGEELHPLLPGVDQCVMMSCPYSIRGSSVGSLVVLAPMRVPYARLFGALHYFSDKLSSFLTKTVTTNKLTYRQSVHADHQQVEGKNWILPHHSPELLLEDQGE